MFDSENFLISSLRSLAITMVDSIPLVKVAFCMLYKYAKLNTNTNIVEISSKVCRRFELIYMPMR